LRALAARPGVRVAETGETGAAGEICQGLAKTGEFCQTLANPENGPRENLPRLGKKRGFLPNLGKTGWRRTGGVFGIAGLYLLGAMPLVVAANGATALAARLCGAGEAMEAARETMGRVLGASGWKQAFLLGAVMLVAPVLEELVFRGWLLRKLVQRFGAWAGLFGSAAVFALCHGRWQVMPPIFVLAVALGAGYARTKSVWTPIAMHVGYNGLAMASFLLFGA